MSLQTFLDKNKSYVWESCSVLKISVNTAITLSYEVNLYKNTLYNPLIYKFESSHLFKEEDI